MKTTLGVVGVAIVCLGVSAIVVRAAFTSKEGGFISKTLTGK
jgi:hypothetical protein